MSEKDLVFKYNGKNVSYGSIDAGELVTGLNGLIKVSSVVLNEYYPKKKAPLRIKAFEKGSFETVLVFIEQYPTFINNAANILVVSIPALVLYFYKKLKPSKDLLPEVREALETILRDPKKCDAVRKGFTYMARPLKSEGMDSVEFGLKGKPQEIINQGNIGSFQHEVENVIRKPISKAGAIRSLNKKNLKGKFETTDGVTYPIKLIMQDPKNYFFYFNMEPIIIIGVALHDAETGEIRRIEIEKIE